MAGPLDKADDQIPTGAKTGAERDWFSDSHELAALTGPDSASKGGKTEPAVISATANSAEIAQSLKQGAHSFDFTSLLQGHQRVVFFGERHDDLGHKNAIIQNLLALKEKTGLTHVALEMLDNADMPSVRSYFNGTGSRQAVLDRLKDRWSVAPGVPEKYMEMIDAVKSARLIPLALDENPSGRDDSRGSLFHDRNEHWAEVINDALKADDKAKVLVYSGRDHVGYSSNGGRANELLKSEYGFDSTVVMFSSKIDKPPTLSSRVTNAAEHSGLSGKQFSLQLDRSNVERPGDIVLHEPE